MVYLNKSLIIINPEGIRNSRFQFILLLIPLFFISLICYSQTGYKLKIGVNGSFSKPFGTFGNVQGNIQLPSDYYYCTGGYGVNGSIDFEIGNAVLKSKITYINYLQDLQAFNQLYNASLDYLVKYIKPGKIHFFSESIGIGFNLINHPKNMLQIESNFVYGFLTLENSVKITDLKTGVIVSSSIFNNYDLFIPQIGIKYSRWIKKGFYFRLESLLSFSQIYKSHIITDYNSLEIQMNNYSFFPLEINVGIEYNVLYHSNKRNKPTSIPNKVSEYQK